MTTMGTLRYSAASAALMVAVHGASAQTRPADQPAGQTPAAAAGDDGGEVIVTARRRAETLISVPDSITAFGKQTIDDRRLSQISDFLSLTPNVRIVREQDAANNEIFIRGVGSNKGQASAVAFVVDGVILPDPDAYTVDLSDAQSVEVLKGPQGALYGKGAAAGAINITTLQPTNDVTGQFKGSYGTGNSWDAFGSVSGPLVHDKLLAQISAKYSKSDGLFTNQFNGRGLGGHEFERISGKLRWQPSDVVTFDVGGSYFHANEQNPPYNAIDVLGTGKSSVTEAQAAAPISHNSSDAGSRSVYTAYLTGSFDTGEGVLKSITAYDRINVIFQQDVDFGPLDVVNAGQVRHVSGYSQELRFTSPAERRFRYILSIYFQNTKRSQDVSLTLDPCFLGIVACPTPPLVESGVHADIHIANTRTETGQYAASAQFSYDLVSHLELTGALRYDRDEPEQLDLLTGNRQRTSFSAWQPKVSLAYKPSADLTVYATAARGYKPGIINPPTVNPRFPTVARKEIVDSVEIGAKAHLFDRKILLTAAAFYTNYKDAQTFQLDVQSGGNLAINIDKVRITGVEADLVARPVRGLSLNTSFGYTKSDIRRFAGGDAYIGQALPYQPRYTFNAGAQYEVAVGQAKIKPRVDFFRYGVTSFQDFQDPNPNRYLRQAPYNTVDAQVSAEFGPVTATVFGRNVFDRRYIQGGFSRYISSLIFVPLKTDVLLPAAGATFGGEVRFRF